MHRNVFRLHPPKHPIDERDADSAKEACRLWHVFLDFGQLGPAFGRCALVDSNWA